MNLSELEVRLQRLLEAHVALNAYRSDGSPEQSEIWHRLLFRRNKEYDSFMAYIQKKTP